MAAIFPGVTTLPASKELERLRTDIVRRYDTLSPRLKQVAAFVLEHPNDMGLSELWIAGRCNAAVHRRRASPRPGYDDGASAMQKLFRDEILSFAPSPSYADRIRQRNERAERPRRCRPTNCCRSSPTATSSRWST